MAGPPCSLRTCLSSSYHRWTKESPLGDVSKPSVRLANLIASNLAVLLTAANARNVYWVIEQPISSKLWIFPPIAQCLSSTLRATTYMGSFGHDMVKPTILAGTLSTLAKLKRRKPQWFAPLQWGDREYYIRNANGVRGGRHLHCSAEYPEAFCSALLQAWLTDPAVVCTGTEKLLEFLGD